MARKFPQGAALLEEAKRLGVSMEDLLTTDGEHLACTALKDIKFQADANLLSYRKGDRIRDWFEISQLRNKNVTDIASTEPELQQRVLQAREHRRLWRLAFISAFASALSAGAAWVAAIRN